jgi:hypothetical protein
LILALIDKLCAWKISQSFSKADREGQVALLFLYFDLICLRVNQLTLVSFSILNRDPK